MQPIYWYRDSKTRRQITKTLDCFNENGICANPAKFQMMFLGLKIKNSICLNIDWQTVKQSEYVKLCGVQIDNKLHFDMHVKDLCQKIN